ncbi:hypothetical protein Tco_1191784 [Tanacetum coccineum]
MSRATSLLPIRSEEALVPKDKQVGISSSNIPDTMLNDTIREMNAYKEYVVKWVRKTRGKGPMIRGEEVSEHVESFKTKIVLSTKKKLASKAKKVKETYGDDPDQMHAATLLSMESERLKLERLEREKLTLEEEIDDDVDDTLEAVKNQKLKGTADTDDEPQMSPDAQLKEKPSGDFVNLDRLTESQTIVVPEVTMTEPTWPDQCGFTVVNPMMHLTLGETPTLGLLHGGNLELTSCTIGSSEIPSDVLAQYINFQVQPITGANDPIPAPPITTITTTNPMAKQFKSLQVINEVKNHAPTLVPNVVAEFIRPCLHKVVSHVLRTKHISLTTKPTLSTTSITIPKLKEKLYCNPCGFSSLIMFYLSPLTF